MAFASSPSSRMLSGSSRWCCIGETAPYLCSSVASIGDGLRAAMQVQALGERASRDSHN